MGNRVVTQALQFLDRDRFRQVMLAAADEDRDVMLSQMKRIRGRAQRNTLYLSTKDGALKLSEWIHGASRGGQTGVTGFDSIDASAVDFSRFGHSYFHEQRQLLNDIFLLVEHGLPPQQRPSIRQAGDGLTWFFQP
jgi:esterase/lipase superfamily enzyme